jgi:hypothetical protein
MKRLAVVISLGMVLAAAPARSTQGFLVTLSSGNFGGQLTSDSLSVHHSATSIYNGDTTAAHTVIAGIAAFNPNGAAGTLITKYFIHGNGQTLSCNSYAVDMVTGNIIGVNGGSRSTDGQDSFEVFTAYSASTNAVQFNTACTLPKAIGSNVAALAGVLQEATL